ncbi:hypothetical protein BLNAU_341 [Blattamonas nauphoetae]|uniref:Uncharacterized protein n=1 Tax=Blattamonas nauphoetae TaxID=2049346 RepID=A0ABQ9YKY8_9EUKA|nr:hypothetical protein BLNAU_341 [Blattamonas nauphoetae]
MRILEKLPTFHEVQMFISLNQSTYRLTDHPHFSDAIFDLTRSTFGKKIVMMNDLPGKLEKFTYMTEAEFEKLDPPRYILDTMKHYRVATFCEDDEAMTEEDRKIKEHNDRQYDQVAIPAQAFFDKDRGHSLQWYYLLRRQNGQLEHRTDSQSSSVVHFMRHISDEKFDLIAAGGAMAIAVTKEQLVYTYRMTTGGDYNAEIGWRVFTQIQHNEDTGLIVTSLGLTKVTQIEFEGLRAFIICENGAVFSVGLTNIFAEYGSFSSFQVLELTDSSKFKPKFLMQYSGYQPSDDDIKYGLFGDLKPVKYFKGSYAFQCEGGKIVQRLVDQPNPFQKKSSWVYLDKNKFFGGEDVLYVTTQSTGTLYCLKNGKMLLTSAEDRISEAEDALLHPYSIRYPNGQVVLDDGSIFDPPPQDTLSVPISFSMDTVSMIILQENTERVLIIFHTGLAVSYGLRKTPPYRHKSGNEEQETGGFKHVIPMNAWMRWMAGSETYLNSSGEKVTNIFFYKHAGKSSVQYYFVFN